MKVAIAADSHENYKHLDWFLAECEERGITECLFLGDFINPHFTKQLAESGLSLRTVWGNNDGHRSLMTQFLLDNGHHVGHLCFAEWEVDGKNVFYTHYPLLGRNAAKSGEYDAAFYGHDHKKYEGKEGDCLLVNPGELSGHLYNTVSFYVWDTETNTGEFVEHPDPVLVRDA